MKAFKIMTTVTGRTIKVLANKTKRYFTIKTESAAYRTYTMTRDEFNSCESMTGNDWSNFLKSDNYFVLK